MPEVLNVVHSDGSVRYKEIFILTYLLLLASLAYVAALAINDFVQQFIGMYVKKNNIYAYGVYALAAITLLLTVVYVGCWAHPPVIKHISLSPV